MNCLDIISHFLENAGIEKNSYFNLLDRFPSHQSKDIVEITLEKGVKTVCNILTDTYALNSQKVKDTAHAIGKKYQPIGRREKDLIKHYLDYHDNYSLEAVCTELQKYGISSEYVSDILKETYEDLSLSATALFVKNWNLACNSNDAPKRLDYLQGIYSRLNDILNAPKLSLLDIYRYNENFIVKELPKTYQNELSEFCSNDKKSSAKKVRALFCEKYEDILARSLKEESRSNRLETVMNMSSCEGTPFEKFDAEDFGLILININQNLYDTCKSDIDFFNKILSLIYHSYRVLDNHRTLAVSINNIFANDGRNLKWELYSYIGIYAEHFIPTVEHRAFYKPEELCYNRCNHLGIELTDAQRCALKQYFKKKLTRQKLKEVLAMTDGELQNILLDFENVWYGYTFSDCIVIEAEEYRQNSELPFIKNKTQALLIFNKYRHDDRKIPCPECAGLDISGNSFPEIGLRSWECKNAICPSRSKSNRGKRYSKKTNFMQRGFENNYENDLISRDMIKIWRRDIAKISSQNEICEMLVKYFSFDKEKVLFINSVKESCETVSRLGRIPKSIESEEISSMHVTDSIFNSYFKNGGYVKRYLNNSPPYEKALDSRLNEKIRKATNPLLIHGNSRDVLAKINSNTFTAAVTSPPYYNARLYSQWQDLYLYLSDMYEVIKETYRTLAPGGIYLYNIGDICGNENTVVNSNMGNKRILLGAYTVHLFLTAGFKLLDDILWDKGNPQSNRQKNDGKFTPFYQKPVNVYEHMFIFKKPGAQVTVSENIFEVLPKEWKTNIAAFSPVIKINSKGENTLGHTAPFPCDIPTFVAKAFTKKPSDIVLDPFAGSGTTLIACNKCGVKALGIELCREYTDLILKQGQVNNVKIEKV